MVRYKLCGADQKIRERGLRWGSGPGRRGGGGGGENKLSALIHLAPHHIHSSPTIYTQVLTIYTPAPCTLKLHYILIPLAPHSL